MPTSPYGIAVINVNGVPQARGGIQVAGSDTIALTGLGISGWQQASWEIYAFPSGWSVPSGWSLRSDGCIVSSDFTPTPFVLPGTGSLWGKWLLRLVVNNGIKNGVPPAYGPDGQLIASDVIDIASGWATTSPNIDLHDIGFAEGGQFSQDRQWLGALQDNFKTLDTAVAAAGSVDTKTAAAPVAQGSSLRTISAGEIHTPSTNLTTQPFHALALEVIPAGENGKVATVGPVDPSVINLGAGVACAVGVNSSGVPVRATNAACVSAPNWLGSCDTDGTITFNPQRDLVFDVTRYGIIGDGTTDCAPAINALLATLTKGGTVFFPAGKYICNSQVGPALGGTIIRGANQASGVATFTELRFTANPTSDPTSAAGSGLYLWRQVNGNTTNNIEVHDIAITNTNASNVTGAAIEFMGGGGNVVKNCTFTGWEYQVILNGAETSEVSFSQCGGEAVGVPVSAVGVWCTNAGDRGAWTVPNSTNFIDIHHCSFNNPLVGVRCFGNISIFVHQNSYNVPATGTAHFFEGGPVVGIIENNYLEGSGDGVDVAFASISAAYSLAIRGNNISGHSIVGIKFVTAISYAIVIEHNFFGISTPNPAVIVTNGVRVSSFTVRNNYYSDTPLFDSTDENQNEGCVIFGNFGLTDTPSRSGGFGINTLALGAELDVVSQGIFESMLRVRNAYGSGPSNWADWRWVSNQHTIFRRGLRSSHAINQVVQDEAAYKSIASGASSTAIVTTEDFPISYHGQIRAEVQAQIEDTSSNGAVWRYVLTINSTSAGVVTIVDGPILEYVHNPLAFAAPTFAIVGADLVVSAVGAPSNASDWVVRLDMTGAQH